MDQLILSKKQSDVIKQILDWFRESKYQYITLGGYAGTGKTTILGYISEILHNQNKDIKVAFCSYTGKASRVLQRKLKNCNAIYDNGYIGTIHRLIYKPIIDNDGTIIGWDKIPKNDFKYSLIVVDESSMVTENIWNDLLSFDTPILAVGDHGQLPPISSNFNLMDNPNLKLEEIFRQEKNNPIITLSEIVRKHGEIPFGSLGDKVSKVKSSEINLLDVVDSFNENLLILCGYNSTRIRLNKEIRQLNFDSPSPQVGDRVICLKNNREMDIYNGMTGTILDITKFNSYYDAEISLDFEEYPFWGKISFDQFNSPTLIAEREEGMNYFDFGYALTVHKAQGSQARKVILFEERFKKMDDDMYARWLYTAVTRAEDELLIIS